MRLDGFTHNKASLLSFSYPFSAVCKLFLFFANAGGSSITTSYFFPEDTVSCKKSKASLTKYFESILKLLSDKFSFTLSISQEDESTKVTDFAPAFKACKPNPPEFENISATVLSLTIFSMKNLLSL